MRYHPNGSGRDFFIVCDEMLRFGKRDKSVHDLFPSAEQTRIFKETSSAHLHLAHDNVEHKAAPKRTNLPSGYAGYKPKAACDPIGRSYFEASKAETVDVVDPCSKTVFLKTAVPNGQKTDELQAKIRTTKLDEVPRGSAGFAEPIAGYSGYRPRQVRNFQ